MESCVNIKDQAPAIGAILGIVFLIIGFNYGNSALWILGFIFLGIGLVAQLKRN